MDRGKEDVMCRCEVSNREEVTQWKLHMVYQVVTQHVACNCVVAIHQLELRLPCVSPLSCVLRPASCDDGRLLGLGIMARRPFCGDRANVNMQVGGAGPWYQVQCGVTERLCTHIDFIRGV